MSCETQCCVLTRGEFLITDWGGKCSCEWDQIFCGHKPLKAFRNIGNVSSCIIENTAQIIGKENQFNPLDDTCARTMIEGVNLSITLECASHKNLLQALYSNKSTPDAGEHHDDFTISTLSDCDRFPLSKLKPDADSIEVVLRNPRGDVVVTLVLGTDYEVHNSVVHIINDSIDVKNGVTLRISYEYDSTGFHEIDFATAFKGYKTLIFKGTNYAADEESVFDAIFKKVIFAPVNQFNLIPVDGFLTLNLTASVEKDDGRFYKLIKQEGATNV